MTQDQDAANQGATPKDELIHDSVGKTSQTDPTPSASTPATGEHESASPNAHSSAVPAAQKAGLLDKDDPSKFSVAALADPASYVRNFAHAVAGHEASLDVKAESGKSFESANEVYDAVKALETRAEAAGFKLVFKNDANNVTHIEVTARTDKQA